MRESAFGKSITSIVRRNCTQLFFVYLGNINRVGSVLEFMRQANLWNRNLTVIRDPYHANYAQGVSDDIPDLESLIDWHEQYWRGLPHVRDIYCAGVSSGGYAALLFGHMLRARKVWAFAPRTARVETAAEAKADLFDLLSIGNGITEYVIYFSPDNQKDRGFAEMFAPCPGVAISAYVTPAGPFSSHLITRYMAEAGELQGIFPPFAPCLEELEGSAHS